MKISPDTICSVLAIASAVIMFFARHTSFFSGWLVITACFTVLVITTRPRTYASVDTPLHGHRGDY